MRYADGPTVEVTRTIDAPPSAVWALVTDIDLPARFSSEYLGGRWLDGEPATVGARFVGRNTHPVRGEWETTSTVIEADAPRAFAYAVDGPDNPGATWRYTLAPEGDGTRITFWMQIGPGPSGLTPAIAAMPDKEERIVAHRCEEHRANMQRTLDGIAELLS